MKIVISGGRSKADFLISFLKQKHHTIVAINNDQKYGEYLASRHDILIVYGDSSKRYVLEDAGIEDFDVLIALTNDDAANLVICQTAKRFFGVRKNVCTVVDPQNVEVFKRLGVSTVISTAYMVARLIEEASTVENFIENIEDARTDPYLASMLGIAPGAGTADPSIGMPRIRIADSDRN